MTRLSLVLLWLSTGCSWMRSPAVSDKDVASSDVHLASYEMTRNRTVYVISNGFHTGIIVRRDDVSREEWPEIENGSTQPWVEIGWGSEVFYTAKAITPMVVAKAVVPNPSVLHVVNWPQPPDEIFAGNVVRLEVSPDGFDAMCRFFHESYDNEDGSPEFLGPGIYGESAFYRARGRYFFANTCNVWTARALREAGVTIIPELCATAQAVMLSVRHADRSERN